MGIRGEIFSTRSNTQSDKRTYFFNVKENRAGDLYLNIVESKKHEETGFERHQIVVFREDITEFLQALGKSVEALKYGPPKKPVKPPAVRLSPAASDTNENSSGESDRDPAAE